ncbi:hypothetical protein RCH14_000441 [Massilia sp. MP_M2]
MPRLSGQDNEGIGVTRHGERYLLKTTPDICVAEFIGAMLCQACDVPMATPQVVDFKGRKVFGSRLESGVELPNDFTQLQSQIGLCANSSIFSAVLAIDLAIGNDDRHWHNWLPQPQQSGEIFLRAVDFSRAWPTRHPPLGFDQIGRENTGLVWREWDSLGVKYDSDSAIDACSRLRRLDASWLGMIFEQLPAEWMVTVSGHDLLDWWRTGWGPRVGAVSNFLEQGAWK